MTTLIVVGSSNLDKIEASRRGFARSFGLESICESAQKNISQIFTEYEVIGHNVTSGVSDQPMSSEEALQGAENRANRALMAEPTARFSIGIEGGLQLVNGIWFNVAWVYVKDLERESFSVACSTGVPVPSGLMHLIHNGTELSYAVDEILETQGMKNRGGWHGVFTQGRMEILPAIEDAVMMAFSGLLCSSKFGGISAEI